MADPTEEILRELDQPVEPRLEFGTRLLDQLLDSLGATPSVALPARPRFPLLREFVAAAAVLVFVIGLAVAFSVLRSGRQPSVSPSPPALSPSPAVILFSGAGNANQVEGMTWDGKSDTVTQVPKASPNQWGASASNPVGTLFVSFPNVVDRSGRVVAKLAGDPNADPTGNAFFGTWADDDLHYCEVAPASGTGTNAERGTLQLTTPGGKPRDVAHVGMQGPGGITLRVTVCSVLADRAVVVQQDQDFIQYWVVHLSNGQTLWTHTLKNTCSPPTGACGLSNVVASRDGRYIAEVPLINAGFIYRPDGSPVESLSLGPSTIFGPNGSRVGRFDGAIRAFSWDGSLALVMASTAGRARVSVIRWSDGTLIWTAPDGKKIWGFQPQPGGTSFGILTADPWGYGYPTAPGVLYVVASDGRVVAQREVGGGPFSGLLVCRPTCVGAAW